MIESFVERVREKDGAREALTEIRREYVEKESERVRQPKRDIERNINIKREREREAEKVEKESERETG